MAPRILVGLVDHAMMRRTNERTALTDAAAGIDVFPPRRSRCGRPVRRRHQHHYQLQETSVGRSVGNPQGRQRCEGPQDHRPRCIARPLKDKAGSRSIKRSIVENSGPRLLHHLMSTLLTRPFRTSVVLLSVLACRIPGWLAHAR